MLVTALTAALALAAPGQAAEPFCRPAPPPPKVSKITRWQRERREFGFRSDRAYVKRVGRSGLRLEGFGFPMTRRERRYLVRRERLDLGAAAYRYLRRHRDLSGGISIEDAWPRPAYMLVRLTRGRAKHTRALRRLVKRPRELRTRTVPVSERALTRLTHSIDFRAAGADGYFLVSAGPDIDTSQVELEVITEKPDAQEYFRARYGPLVRVIVTGTELYSPECTTVEGWQADGAELTVHYQAGGGVELQRVEVTEHPDRVELGVVVLGFNGPRTADSVIAETTVTLAAPLGDRHVVDASTGKRVARGDGRPFRAR